MQITRNLQWNNNSGVHKRGINKEYYMITDIIIVLVLALILGGALWYMKKEKDKGTTCIGCPDAGTCAKRQAGEACKKP